MPEEMTAQETSVWVNVYCVKIKQGSEVFRPHSDGAQWQIQNATLAADAAVMLLRERTRSEK